MLENTMTDRDGQLAVLGPDPSGMKLLIAAVLAAELDKFPPDPSCDTDIAKGLADKAESYAHYLSLFFIVTRRKKKR